MTPQPILLLGGGGHCRACIDVIETNGQYQIKGIIDVEAMVGKNLFGYPIIGTDEQLPDLLKETPNVIITLGQIHSSEGRKRLYELAKSHGAILPSITSPLAHVSKNAKIGEGTIVMHQAIVSAGADVGHNCIINTKSLIEHDSKIGNHCHISTASVVNGDCQLGEGVMLGSQSTLKQGVKIENHSLIGFGTLVRNDVPANTKVF